MSFNFRSFFIFFYVLLFVLVGCSSDDESHKINIFTFPHYKTFDFILPTFLSEEKSPLLDKEHLQYENFNSYSELNMQLKNEYGQTLEFLSSIISKKPQILPAYNKKDTLWFWNYNLDYKEEKYNVLIELKQKTNNNWVIKINDIEKAEYQTITKGASNNENTSGQWICNTSTILGAEESIGFIKIDWELTEFNEFKKQVFTVTDSKSTLYNNIYTFTPTTLGNYTNHINLKKTVESTSIVLDLLYNNVDLQGHIQKTTGLEVESYCWDDKYNPIDCVVTSLTSTTEQ